MTTPTDHEGRSLSHCCLQIWRSQSVQLHQTACWFAPHDIRVLAGEGTWHVPCPTERDLVSHSPWHPTLMMSLTVDGPELQLEAAHLLDLGRKVLHEDLQLGSLFLVVREFIAG